MALLSVRHWWQQLARDARRDRRRAPLVRRARSSLWIESLEDRSLMSTFTVLNTNDSGPGSLRQAILDSNGTPGSNTIAFAIETGHQVITLTSSLPTVTRQAVIDGATQPGFAGTPLIELNGNNLGASGLSINAAGCTVRGLDINRFNGYGIQLNNNQNVIVGNYIGTDWMGTTTQGNTRDGVAVNSAGNTIGGTTAALRNLIAANRGSGISISGPGARNNQVLGNYIGTDAGGTMPLANAGFGVLVNNGAFNNTIGGTLAGAGNLIAGNTSDGVRIDSANATGNQLLGNFIGTNVMGTIALPNGGVGVLIGTSASNNTIGGTVAAARNIISGNGSVGLFIADGMRNVVQGNYIGTTADGTAALGNAADGLVIQRADNNTIGGSTAGAGNVISGNRGSGVSTGASIGGTGGTANIIQGNYIGTNAAGTAALGNRGDGISFGGSTQNTTIGGTTAAARNIISGNTGGGINLNGTQVTGNQVLGNYVGTNVAGTMALPNGGAGVAVTGASSNTVGGPAPGARNVISGNGGGVRIGDGAGDNRLQGNFIGTDATGTARLGNQGFGVILQGPAPNTLIGGTAAGARNVISGNGQAGIWINASGTTQVVGNYIGTDVTGNVALGNAIRGVLIQDSPGNTLGGTAVEARNIISGNGDNGVLIFGPGSTGNVVLGNFIGTSADGAAALGNARSGILIDNAANTTVGGTMTTARNVISGNDGSGIWIRGVSATNNLVLGNYIGTDATGTRGFTFSSTGVEIGIGASNNQIGGTDASARNIISANDQGVVISGATTTGNVVQGNYIGTDVTGTADLGNLSYGVHVSAPNNLIGGPDPGAGNVVAASGREGVYLDNVNATGNVVQANYIGTDASGATALSNSAGILVGFGANSNTLAGNLISGNRGDGISINNVNGTANGVLGNQIGTDAGGTVALANIGVGVRINSANNILAGNVIAGNRGDGILISGVAATGNLVQGNFIGADSSGTIPLGNGSNGVEIVNASANTIGGTDPGAGNTIANNANDGVLVDTGSGNAIQQNSITASGKLGIELLRNGNNNEAAPVLTAAATDGSSTTIVGTLTSTPNATFTLEFYANDTANPSGYGEGLIYLGSWTVTTDDSGNGSFTAVFDTGDTTGLLLAATATDPDNNTSAFSLSLPVDGPSGSGTPVVVLSRTSETADQRIESVLLAEQRGPARFSPGDDLDRFFSRVTHDGPVGSRLLGEPGYLHSLLSSCTSDDRDPFATGG